MDKLKDYVVQISSYIDKNMNLHKIRKLVDSQIETQQLGELKFEDRGFYNPNPYLEYCYYNFRYEKLIKKVPKKKDYYTFHFTNRKQLVRIDYYWFKEDVHIIDKVEYVLYFDNYTIGYIFSDNKISRIRICLYNKDKITSIYYVYCNENYEIKSCYVTEFVYHTEKQIEVKNFIVDVDFNEIINQCDSKFELKNFTDPVVKERFIENETLSSSEIYLELRRVLYKTMLDTINKWKDTDIYVASLFYYEGNTVWDPEVGFGYNTEKRCKDNDLRCERRWNYAEWIQNDINLLGIQEIKEVYNKWINSLHENQSPDSEEIVNKFLELLVKLIQDITKSNIIEKKLRKNIPIIFQELEPTSKVVNLTIEANEASLIQNYLIYLKEIMGLDI